MTEKNYIHVVVTEGEYKGFRACELCLAYGPEDNDAKLQMRIKRLEEEAEALKSIRGRLDLPTFEQWEEKEKQAGYEAARAKFNSDEELQQWIKESGQEVMNQAVKAGDVPPWARMEA